MPQPNVSIIMPSFNSNGYIRKSIESIQRQTYTNWELVVVDDCSSDSSIQTLLDICENDKRITFTRLSQNSGSAVARNAAIEIAKGRYIAFLDSDDEWLPEKLEKQLKFMERKKAPFSFTGYEKVDEAGKTLGKVGVPEMVNYNGLLKTNVVGCLTAIYDTYYFGKVNMPLVRKRQDFGLWLKLLKKTPYAYGLNLVLAKYRIRNDSVSANKKSAASHTWRLYRDVEKLSFIKAGYYFVHYAIRGVMRKHYPSLARFFGVLD